MTTNKIPPANEDPRIIAARAATQTYEQSIAATRRDTQLSDLAKAEAIASAWQALQATYAKLEAEFYEVRRTRLAKLEALVPIGPNIPADTARADAAVLHQAFSTAFATAREATPEQLGSMWADAKRFDDDTTKRAVLTASIDRGLDVFLKDWAAGEPGMELGIKEARSLRQTVNGYGTDVRIAEQAFGRMFLPQPPNELKQLTILRQQAGV